MKVETQSTGGSYQVRADNFTYTSAGAVSSMMLGNSKWENAQFNSRLQPVQIGLGTSATDQSLWKVSYDYGTTNNNGNVLSQTITVTSINPLVQTYTYDSLNRIKSAVETQNSSETWKQTFTYDRYGNRNFDATNTTTLGSCSTAQCNPTIDAANNRFTTGQGYTYDLSGNLITDAQSRTFTYDAENKQKTVATTVDVTGTYSYDGDGKRVKKVTASEITHFVYDANGVLAAEYLLTESTPQTATTSYLTSDLLGSPRVITDQSGNVTSRRDFMPFGEDISGVGNRNQPNGYQSDAIRQKFTGYERDNESSLDFAQTRMYSPKQGRFMISDQPFMDQDENTPQSWNLFSYVRNNPLIFIDPTGQMGDFYDPDTGEYLGTDGINDKLVYTAKEKSKREENGKVYRQLVNVVLLKNINHDEFQRRAATVYGESSAGFGAEENEELRREMGAIAYVHVNRNDTAYADTSAQAQIFRSTKLENRVGKMQYAVWAVLNALRGGIDYSNGADSWDGAEQAQFPSSDTRRSTGRFELHMNTMGWNISDEHYSKWKANVGPSFQALQIRIAPNNYGGYRNKGKTRLYSTAVYNKTIFWRTK